MDGKRLQRYARHWHDLAALACSPYFAPAIADREVAMAVARHKSFFFLEKDTDGKVIDYEAAASGHLQIVPSGEARSALAADYANMCADQVMLGEAMEFDQLMQACADVEMLANRSAVQK